MRRAVVDLGSTRPVGNMLDWALTSLRRARGRGWSVEPVPAPAAQFWEREASLIVENVGRYRTGRKLRNVVDRQAGY